MTTKADQDDPQPVKGDDAAQLAWLKHRVEALSDGPPMWSRTAYTQRHTVHTIFVNGAVKQEAAGRLLVTLDRDLRERVREQLLAITAHRQTISGPVDLVWRIEPEINDVGDLYTRLSFEPSLEAVASGVYVHRTLVEPGRCS